MYLDPTHSHPLTSALCPYTTTQNKTEFKRKNGENKIRKIKMEGI